MVCRFWKELDNEMGLYEFCRLTEKKCTCSGEIEQCNYPIIKCPYCKRLVVNANYLTKEKCIWCDCEYHYEKNK